MCRPFLLAVAALLSVAFALPALQIQPPGVPARPGKAKPADPPKKDEPPPAPAKPVGPGFTAADLQKKKFAPINWVVPGIVVEGLTLLAGKPKRGKSWFALNLALAVAQGGTTLGAITAPSPTTTPSTRTAREPMKAPSSTTTGRA